jgi:VWFA-related protein
VSRRVVSIVGGSACALLVASQLLLPVSAQQAPDVPRFRVGVDAVRIDAVVTDRDGRIVSDLTAADFEVRQNGKLQKVTFAQFVPVLTGADPPSRSESTPAAAPAATAPLTAPLVTIKKEDVQRTFALVVDDLGLSVESVQPMRRALHDFVDRELRPTDLVAMVRTGGSGGALQSFTTDRRVLHAAIDNLRWNVMSRSGVEPFESINIFETFTGGPGGLAAPPTDFSAVNQLRNSSSAAGSLAALNLVIRGARSLPGRKAVVFVSEGFQLLVPELTGSGSGGRQPDARVRAALDRVVDQATRAGVVIYSLDARGLQTAGVQASDNLKSADTSVGAMEGLVRDQGANRAAFNRDTQEGLAYVAEQTGGFAVRNTNDIAKGLGRITNDVRGYYVIGYVPLEGTFAKPGQKPSLHKIAVKVGRPGLRVKTRKQFLGVSDPPDAVATLTPAQELVRAATSPFSAAALSLRATSLPGYSPAEGTFVRSLLHVDARGLTFADDAAGKKTAAVDVLGMVFDHDGDEVAHLSTGFAVALTDAGAEEALRDGVAYTFRIPIRRPGGYQVRFAIRDQRSGALGSAGEFVDVADMAGGAFALSGIVLRSDADKGPPAADRLAVMPAQAVRIYPAGARLSYAYEIYNASKTVRAGPSIWRGAEQVFAAPPDTLTVPDGGTRRFGAAGELQIAKLPPGSYVLQVTAVTEDPRRSGRSRTAIQRTTFDVR